MNKWIRDKKPKDGEMVLLLCEHEWNEKVIVIGDYSDKYDSYFEHQEYFTSAISEWEEIKDKVIGWIPLPSTEL